MDNPFCVFRMYRAEYQQQTPSLLCSASAPLHIHSWSDSRRSRPHPHGRTLVFLRSSKTQSPHSDTGWFQLRRDKRRNKKEQISRGGVAKKKRAQYQFVTLTLCTVAGLPHVAAGAACGVGARGPFAGAILRDVVAFAHALQRVHLAHAQQHRPCGRGGGGTQIQRRSGERHTSGRKLNWQPVAQQKATTLCSTCTRKASCKRIFPWQTSPTACTEPQDGLPVL